MAMGARILERLEEEGHLGPKGGIARLTKRLDQAFEDLARRLPGVVTARSGLGAMQGFVAWQGNAAITQEIVEASLEEGALFQTAGSNPTRVRLLPAITLTDEELAAGFAALERGFGKWVGDAVSLSIRSPGPGPELDQRLVSFALSRAERRGP